MKASAELGEGERLMGKPHSSSTYLVSRWIEPRMRFAKWRRVRHRSFKVAMNGRMEARKPLSFGDAATERSGMNQHTVAATDFWYVPSREQDEGGGPPNGFA